MQPGNDVATRLFLSYAEEDNAIADEIIRWLEQQPHLDVYHWRDERQRGRRIVETIEKEIRNAHFLLALLSPHYLNSRWCQLEKDLAVHREMDRRGSNPTDPRPFIFVLEIVKTPLESAGSLREFPWFDGSSSERRAEELRILADRLRAGSAAVAKGSATGRADPEASSPIFRNRSHELNLLVNDLTNTGGHHFWLVLAPPQLGKSWFLARLSATIATEAPNWVTKLVDLSDQPDAHGDAALLLGRLFDLPRSVTMEQLDVEAIASQISTGKRPYLCLLDSADLLEKEAAKQLRTTLSQIYWLVREAGNPDVRLAFVAASRREREWRGVAPRPRLSLLPLTEFDVYVVERALRDMARDHGHHGLGNDWFQKNARRVHELSEGLPALLDRCLRWIQQRGFVISRQGLAVEQHLFKEFARPYIEQELLSPKSLFPYGGVAAKRGELVRRHAALEQAFRALAPYRLITQSHLRHCLTSDTELKEALNALGWQVEALWRAIGDTALLVSPDEPWQAICPAIRRLLYRFYYTSDEARKEAHRVAVDFYGGWLHEPAGKEQSVMLVERLWHQASLLLLERPADLEDALIGFARDLCETIQAPRALSPEELRRYAAERMQNDDEFQDALEPYPGLFDRLVEIVEPPA